MTFGKAVRDVRRAHHLTQQQLAEGLGLCEGMVVSRWERGTLDRSWLLLRAMWQADPTFARIAQEIWRLTT